MPIYEYFCQDCDKKFDVKASISEKQKGLKVRCPACGSSKIGKILSNFFAFSKCNNSNLSGSCGLNSKPGCCS